MTGWLKVPLRRVARVVNGGTPTPDEMNWGGDISWATPIDIGAANGRIVRTQRTLTRPGAMSSSRIVPAESVLVSTRAPIGYVAIADKPMAFNQGCRAIVPSEQLDARFLYYQLSVLSAELNRRGLGTTFLELSADNLAGIEVALPPLDEQRRIADFLDAETGRIDQLSGLRESMIASLLEFRRSFISEGVIVDENVPWVRLGYLSSLITSGPRGWGDYVDAKGSLFFRSANLRRDSIEPNLTEVVRVNPPMSAESEARRSRIRSGDVLVGITGANTGWVARAGAEIVGANVSQHVCLVRPGSDLDSSWLVYFLMAPSVQDVLLGAQYGGTKTQLSLPDIRNLRVPLVAVDLQVSVAHQITEKLQAISQLISMQASQRALLAQRKQALIAAAVTGQFDVTTPRGADLS